MAELITIEKGDKIITKDGRELRVLSVYKPDGTIIRVDGVEDNVPNPIRVPVFSKDIGRVMKRQKPQESHAPAPQAPSEAVVHTKAPVSEAIKQDIDNRPKSKTTSAESKEKNQAEANSSGKAGKK